MTASAAVTYRRVRAPVEDSGVLIDPPLTEVAELLRANASAFASPVTIAGRTLSDLRVQARLELLSAALSYTRVYRDVPDPPRGAVPFFLGGHQPQLFHPGVWYKILLSRLAREHRGVAINLSIDNDVAKGASIRVPSGSAATPVLESLSYDASFSELPYEVRRIQDRELFASFGKRVAATIRPLIAEPLVKAFWPLAVERARATENLGAAVAQARHQLEGTWGAATLEVPQSVVCGLPSFQHFAAHLLADLPRFVEVHNAALAEYRRVHRLRNAAHPVPDLARQDDWYEVPFWIWDRTNPQRRRLFARAIGEAEVELTDRGDWRIRLSVRNADRIAALAEQGIKLRTRALTTTLFARLLLADIFVHGIGGAKYDQITDVLLARFYGLTPPGFMIASVTLRLPVPHTRITPDMLRDADERLRRLVYQPERSAEEFSADCRRGVEAQQWLAQKRTWLATAATKENAQTRCRAIREANERLQPCVAELRETLLRERQAIQAGLRAESVLGSREYAFCLFPEDSLRRQMEV